MLCQQFIWDSVTQDWKIVNQLIFLEVVCKCLIGILSEIRLLSKPVAGWEIINVQSLSTNCSQCVCRRVWMLCQQFIWDSVTQDWKIV